MWSYPHWSRDQPRVISIGAGANRDKSMLLLLNFKTSMSEYNTQCHYYYRFSGKSMLELD